MDNNNNNNTTTTTSYISRIIRGVKEGTPLSPAVTPESISSIFIGNSKEISSSNNNRKDIFNYNYYPTLRYLSNEKSGSSVDDLKTDVNHSGKIGIPEKKPLEKREEYNNYFDVEIQVPQSTKDEGKAGRTYKEIQEPQSTKDEGKAGRGYDLKNNKNIIDNNVDIKEISGSFSKKERKALLSNSQKILGKSIPLKPDDTSNKINISPSGRAKNRISNQQLQPLQQHFLSNKTAIEHDLFSRNIIQRLQKNELLKRTFEPTITINIGKITVKASKDIHSLSHNINKVESMGPKVQSLNDYLNIKRSKI